MTTPKIPTTKQNASLFTNHLISDGKARVRVWHRTDHDAFVRGWDSQPDFPQLVLAYEYEVDVADLSEECPHFDCFRINIRVDGTDWEMPVKHNTRSLSIGDVVEIGLPNQTMFWGVNPLSWQTVTAQQVTDAQRRQQQKI